MTSLIVCGESVKSDGSRKDMECTSSKSDSPIMQEGIKEEKINSSNERDVSPTSDDASPNSSSDDVSDESFSKSDAEAFISSFDYDCDYDESKMKGILCNDNVSNLRY